MSLDAVDVPLSQLCRQINMETGISVVVSSSVASSLVSCVVVDQPVDHVVQLLAKSAEVSVSWSTARMVYVGELGEEDEAVMFRRVRRGSADEVQALAKVVQTSGGQVFVSDDGLCVAVDLLAGVERLNDVLEELEAVRTPVWLVEVFGLQTSDDFQRRLQLEVSPNALR